jgi:hypothetical protein
VCSSDLEAGAGAVAVLMDYSEKAEAVRDEDRRKD